MTASTLRLQNVTRKSLFCLSVLLAGATFLVVPLGGAQEAPTPGLTVRITSPLGRTGIHGPIRIVAQVQHASDVVLQPVKFFVDQKLQGEAKQGPPFAVEWTDENPYEGREIAVEVCSMAGDCVRDVVKLDPLVLLEEAEVSSVL